MYFVLLLRLTPDQTEPSLYAEYFMWLIVCKTWGRADGAGVGVPGGTARVRPSETRMTGVGSDVIYIGSDSTAVYAPWHWGLITYPKEWLLRARISPRFSCSCKVEQSARFIRAWNALCRTRLIATGRCISPIQLYHRRVLNKFNSQLSIRLNVAETCKNRYWRS